MIQFRKTGSVAESAASHLSTGKKIKSTAQNDVIMQKKEKHRRPAENI